MLESGGEINSSPDESGSPLNEAIGKYIEKLEEDAEETISANGKRGYLAIAVLLNAFKGNPRLTLGEIRTIFSEYSFSKNYKLRSAGDRMTRLCKRLEFRTFGLIVKKRPRGKLTEKAVYTISLLAEEENQGGQK